MSSSCHFSNSLTLHAKFSIQMECIMYVISIYMYIYTDISFAPSAKFPALTYSVSVPGFISGPEKRQICMHMYKLHVSIRLESRSDAWNARIEFVIHFPDIVFFPLEFDLYVYIYVFVISFFFVLVFVTFDIRSFYVHIENLNWLLAFIAWLRFFAFL